MLASAAPARNVVVILVDDLGWRDLACMGSPVYETPHIDALAQSGTLFSNAYAPSPICSPSRAAILTGSQPSRHGVYTVVKNRGKKSQWKVIPEKNRQFLDKDYPNLCTYFGVEPTDPDKVDGEDLTELLFEGKSLGERNLFWNFPAYNDPEAPARRPRSALRRGDWKIIHRYEDNGYELYNLKKDIAESNDLSQTQPQKLKDMRRHLEASYVRFGATAALPPNPEFKPDSR